MAPARLIMLQGTGSDVGKSLLVAALGRALANRGYRVAPFKPQNMANNAAPAGDGREIGRAQALQATACRQAPQSAMNPVLLKPQPGGAQLIVDGQLQRALPAASYQAVKGELMPAVLDAAGRLAAANDIVLVEGAGSPAEINLRPGDIANMGFARAAGAPVALVGDIDRGGVMAQIYGTWALLAAADRACLAGFIVNRFRGDASLFAQGRRQLADLTGLADFGLVPHTDLARQLPAEDSLALDRGLAAQTGDGARPAEPGFRIAVPRLPYIANFDDLDPLRLEPALALTVVPPGEPLPACDLVLLPGSKAVRADLAALRDAGWAAQIAAHARAGGAVLGLCGGYQMLGQDIADPEGIEGSPGRSPGLGLLGITTTLGARKALGTRRLRPAWPAEATLEGYEMHMGVTEGPATQRPLLYDATDGQPHGAVAADGQVMGTYLHGLFQADSGRRALLQRLGARPSSAVSYASSLDAALNALAAHVEAHLAVDALLARAAPFAPPAGYSESGASAAS